MYFITDRDLYTKISIQSRHEFIDNNYYFLFISDYDLITFWFLCWEMHYLKNQNAVHTCQKYLMKEVKTNWNQGTHISNILYHCRIFPCVILLLYAQTVNCICSCSNSMDFRKRSKDFCWGLNDTCLMYMQSKTALSV